MWGSVTLLSFVAKARRANLVHSARQRSEQIVGYMTTTHEYAESMSMYSFPSGSQTLSERNQCPKIQEIIQLLNLLGALCAVEDDRKRVVAILTIG